MGYVRKGITAATSEGCALVRWVVLPDGSREAATGPEVARLTGASI
ncbi:MAG TPA: hypothetical protein VIP46_14065 [Pyrinomonadaceae bacterium]